MANRGATQIVVMRTGIRREEADTNTKMVYTGDCVSMDESTLVCDGSSWSLPPVAVLPSVEVEER